MKMKFRIILSLSLVLLVVLAGAAFCIFFDEAVFNRKGTIYRVNSSEKLVALTFDDGPSPVWTPKILDELKAAGVKATFFMLGEHVARYPDVARRVVNEGHEIGNHTYDHHVLLYYTMKELEDELNYADRVIKGVTGVETKYFRPPKAWLTKEEKVEVNAMGYQVILWSLNSKDWVTFHDKQITSYILRRIRSGDIILFHDSGGAFTAEGGDRSQTVKTIPRLVKKLKERGYKFVTITQLLKGAQ
ncbi:MAG: polysaccharide deacetylase family protein [Candidatus Omnitrophica bacterium]|nr:polysaccharide deacetylase family protein [Candidatus Omnitrophota bacterium]